MTAKSRVKERITPMGWIMGFLLFSLIPAFYVWNNPLYNLLSVVVAALVLIDIVQHKRDGRSSYHTIGCVIFIIVYLIYLLRGNFNIPGIILKLSVLPLLFARRELFKDSLKAFVIIYGVSMAISLVVYFLVTWLGVGLPSRVIAPWNDLKEATYYLYPFLVTVVDSSSLLDASFIRFHGFFDEGGVVGTISAIILVTENFNFRKLTNIVALVCGVFSFSLFFYLIVFAAIILNAPGKFKIGAIVVVAVALYLLRDNEIMDQMLFRRFSDESALGFVDNRNTGYFADVYEKFSKTTAFWTGMGAGKAEVLGEGGSSYKMLVYDYGMIFFIFYVLSFYFFAFGVIKGWRQYLAFSMILLGTMYQRPFLGGVSFTFIMLAAPHLIAEHYSSVKTPQKVNTKKKSKQLQYAAETTIS